jgi:hypothetical protein
MSIERPAGRGFRQSRHRRSRQTRGLASIRNDREESQRNPPEAAMDAKFDPTAEATVSLETRVAVSGGFEDSPLEG